MAVTKRGDRTHLIRIYLGRVNGKRQYHNETFHGTKKQADQRHRDLLTRRDQGLLLPRGGDVDTVDGYADHWLDTIQVRARTRAGYESTLRLYVRPRLGNLPLRQVTRPTVRELIVGLDQTSLSPRTVRKAHEVLRNLLESAVADGLVPFNPAKGRAVTRVPPKKEGKERVTIPPEKVGAFLEAAREDRLYGLWAFLLLGLRPEEALALRWADVEGGRVRVRRVLVDRSGIWPKYEEPKSDKSRRSIPQPAMAREALAEHRRRQAKERLAAGVAWQDENLVFSDEAGQPLRQHNLRAPFKRILKRAKLPDMRLYDLRHSCATLLLEAGESLEAVKQWLGHSTITLTSDTYGGLSGIRDSAAAALDRVAGT